MADSDFNVIRPVESLQTIQGLAPTTRRQERRRQQQQPKEEDQSEAQENHEAPTEPQAKRADDDPHSIDYCA
jgi:hypothetical protein